MAHTEVQLDFILEMYALDHPKEARFLRPGKAEPLPSSAIAAAWTRVLDGSALHEMMGKYLPPQALLDKLKNRSKVMKPRMVKGPGK